MATKRDRSHEKEPEEDALGEVIFVERQFPVVLRWPLIWGLIIILVGMIPWSISTANAYSWQPWAVKWMILGFLVLLAYWGYHFSGWYFTVLVLSDDEITLVKQKGFFQRSVQSLTLNNVQSVNYSVPGLQAAIFRYGDLKISTLSGSGDMTITTMYRPARLQTEIMEALQAYGSTASEGIVYDSEDNSDQD